MGEEKERLSGDGSRSSPALPIANPDIEKLQAQQDLKSNGIHPAFYVMFVPKSPYRDGDYLLTLG